MAILIWIPVAALFLSIGLMVMLAGSCHFPPATALAALCMAFAP